MNAKLFVRNLSWSVTEEELFHIFSQVGQVVSVKIPTRREDGRSRGFAFVEMASESDGQNAVDNLNQYTLKNREILVTFQEESRQRPEGRSKKAFAPVDPNPSLFVRNVAPMVTEDQLRTLFGQEGGVVTIKVPIDRETGYARGFAFAEMESTEAAQKVIDRFSGMEIDGVALMIHFQDPERVQRAATRQEDSSRYAMAGYGRGGQEDAYAPYPIQDDEY